MSSPSIVQRIQRFGDFGAVKRTALEHIAGTVLKQNHAFSSAASEPVRFLDDRTASLNAANSASITAESTQLQPIAEADGAAEAADAADAAPARTVADAVAAAKVPGLGNGLLEHMMMSDGTVRPPPPPSLLLSVLLPFCRLSHCTPWALLPARKAAARLCAPLP